jgi:hypothetical protein
MGRTRQVVMSAIALAMAVPAAGAIAQAPDAVTGTWVLNLAKSKYDPGPAPKSGTRTYTAAPNGYTFSSDGVNAGGDKVHVEFTVAFDGKYHVVTGSSVFDSIMVKRVDASTVESTQKKGANVVTRTTRTISRDGKTLTSTSKGTNAEGRAVSNVEVYDKK